ncbi:MAG: geranylgeranylglycerol-phosphate geranylgeranyltransferase [Bacteroidota bacterium]
MRRQPAFTLPDFIRLVRWPNLTIMAFTQYMVACFLINDSFRPLQVLRNRPMMLISLATVLIAAAGYIINDYYDIKIDTVNKPGRVIIGRSLKRQYAIAIHTLLSITGILLAATLSKRTGFICLACVFLLWLYSNTLKRTPLLGNVLIGLLTAICIWLPADYYRHQATGNAKVVFAFAVWAFFISLIRELIKDMEDLRGDARFGARTLPVVWGIRRTKYLVFAASAAFAVSLFYAAEKLSIFLMLYFGLLMAPLGYLLYLTYKADTRKKFSRLSSLFKWLMLLGVLSMAFL